MKKKPYFTVKVPIFPANIYVCMDEISFRQALKDKNVTQKIEMLEGGAMAETHSVPTADGKTMISLVLDLLSIDDLDSTLVHEAVHLTERIFEYIGEESAGEEIRAYLTEYIYSAIKRGIDEHGIGKRNRKLLDEKNQAVVGALLQMAEHSNGSARSDSVPKQPNTSSGIENIEWGAIPAPDSSL
jgi:hypothetical protein